VDPRLRLYWADPLQLEFDAVVRERRPLPDGTGLVLDRSAFYPTSGGQPHDTGTLNGEPVLDVFEAADGAVVHRVATAGAEERVHGCVDGARRRDHMQQHSGQHLLSATALALLQRDTLSFHLGRERCAIDLPGGALTDAEIEALERRANEIIWDARPVEARFLTAGEAAALRKPPPPGSGPVRVVEIAGWDRSACCGTHVARSSEIGLVKLLAQEKVKPGTRLHFVCGGRALAECGQAMRRVEVLALALTCHPDALQSKIAQLAADAKTAHKEADALRARVAALEAQNWLQDAVRPAGVPVVVHDAPDADPLLLRAWADALVAQGAVALLGARAPRAALLFARPDGIELDLRTVLPAAAAAIDGKGGGPPARVQATGNRADSVGEALELARAAVTLALERGAAP